MICDPRLLTLFKRSLPELHVIARDADASAISSQIPSGSDMVFCLASIGLSCIAGETDIPFGKAPWLKSEPRRIAEFTSYMKERAHGKIPLAFGCWSAGIAGKSIPPEDFLLPFVHLRDRFSFVNVQGFPPHDEVRPSQLKQAFRNVFGENASIECPIDLWNDIDGTAALLQAVKDLNGLAVMIPNYTEMVVCGIGLPHYKPLHADWNFWYGAGRVWNEDWFIYKQTQTFLQSEPGNWKEPLERIAKALENFVPGQVDSNPIRHDRMSFKPATPDDMQPVFFTPT